MDATIAAAWITGGVGALGIAGTVSTAIVGARNTRRATEATIAAGAATTAATLVAAREDRLWEKQCAAYEETIAGLMYRQRKRNQDLQMYRLEEQMYRREEEPEQQLKDFFSDYEPPGWVEAQARLVAYASGAVLAASAGTQWVDLEAWKLFRQWLTMVEDNKLAAEAGSPWAGADDHTMIKARREVNLALDQASTQDQALITVIRDELRGKPEAATLPAPVPAKRRRIWHRG